MKLFLHINAKKIETIISYFDNYLWNVGIQKDFYKFKNDLKELYLFDYILCNYQIKTDKFIYIDLPTNIFLIEHPIEIKHQYIYPMQIINHNDLKTVYYILNQHNRLSLLNDDLLKYDLYSYDFNYFVRKEYKPFKIEDIEYKVLYKITLYLNTHNLQVTI